MEQWDAGNPYSMQAIRIKLGVSAEAAAGSRGQSVGEYLEWESQYDDVNVMEKIGLGKPRPYRKRNLKVQ